MPIFGQIRMKTANFTPDLGGSPGTGKHRQRFPPQRSLITGCPLTHTGDTRAFVYLPCLPHKVLKMNTSALTAQNCSLFEIDAELEAAFDQMQEEQEITGNIRPGWG